MTVAVAEQINTDFELWEHEFVAERPAEAEIYGRSLSSIHRLGAFMVDKATADIVNSPEAAQARVEFYTSVEEGFGTDKELGGGLEVRDFDVRPIMDGRVMAKDLKTAVSAMTDAGLACGIEAAKKDERFLPQLTRSERDHENALLVDKMARGETGYNTRIVISPFPEEAAAKSGDAYWRNIGYVPHLRRGFVQLYHADEDGLVAGSLSFDGSDKTRLREVFAKYGVEIPVGEVTDNWLQYAITGNLSEAAAKELALEIADQAADPKYRKNTNTVDVTSEYRAIMDTVFNESYVHICESLFNGHQTPEARKLIFALADKAQSFNQRYAKVLYDLRANPAQFSDNDSIILHELLVYSTIEMMRALHIQKTKRTFANDDTNVLIGGLDVVQLQAMNPAMFQSMLSGFGAEGAMSGRTYSACGLAISPGEMAKNNGERDATLDPSLDPQYAFGGQTKKEQTSSPEGGDGKGSRTFRCTQGHWNIRPKYALLKECRVKSCPKGSVGC